MCQLIKGRKGEAVIEEGERRSISSEYFHDLRDDSEANLSRIGREGRELRQVEKMAILVKKSGEYNEENENKGISCIK